MVLLRTQNGRRARMDSAAAVTTRLDRAADRAQDLADLSAQEDEGDDRDDGDEGEDQRVLREALAVFVAMDEFHDLEIDRRHVSFLLDEYSPPDEGFATIHDACGDVTE